MNERNLSRKLSSSVVDALKAHGHILVVKGGATALARELEDLMAPEIVTIEPRLRPYSILVEEPTSTFGDETIDQTVEDMVQKLTHALMHSDHVEDVFAEDAVIRRDIFRVVRDGLREPTVEGAEGDDADEASVTVKLDALGYVAATAARRADTSTLRGALDRAASAVAARFAALNPELREATFRLEGGGVDERLELEEAVADELTDLVEQGIVDLPTIERRLDLGRPIPPAEQRAQRGRIAAAAETTLLRSGCAAEWAFTDPRTLRVLFTPLSEHDADGIEAPTSAFAREITALFGGRTAAPEPPAKAAAKAVAAVAPAPPETPRPAARPAPTPAKRGAAPVSAKPSSKSAPAEAAPSPPPPAPSEPAPKRRTKAAREEPPAEEPAPPAKRVAKKAATKTPSSSRKGTAASAKTAKTAKTKKA